MSAFLEAIKRAAKEVVEASDPVALKTGTVERDSPLEIRLDQKTLLDKDFLILTPEVRDYKVDVTVDGTRRRCQVHKALKKGDKCLLVREQGGQNYLVLCRLE